MMIMLIIVMIMCNLHLQAPWMTWVKGQRGRRVRMVEVPHRETKVFTTSTQSKVLKRNLLCSQV